MGIFDIFKRKNKKEKLQEKLQEKYEKLMQESFNLSKINRKLSDAKYAEAEEVLKQIGKL